MKRFLLILILGFNLPSTASAQCPDVVGDVNQSSQVDVVDVQCSILAALGALTETPDLAPCAAPESVDVNCDGATDVTDTIMVIAQAMGIPFPIQADANGNICPNDCDQPPTTLGDPMPLWELVDEQPLSPKVGVTYGLADMPGVRLVALLDGG